MVSKIQNDYCREVDYKILLQKLNSVEKFIDFDERVANDPIQFVKRYDNPPDIETAGLISAVMAMGKVELIIRNLEDIFSRFDSSPSEFIDNFTGKNARLFDNVKYRLYNSHDIKTLLWCIGEVRKKWGSLERLFSKSYNGGASKKDGLRNFTEGLEFFSKTFKELARESPYNEQRNFSHFFPQPSKGSACKRLCLFTRWMVRKKKPDFGIWKSVNPGDLVIPVDTHISRIGRYLGFTKRKSAGNWKMALEITGALKKMDPSDPIRLDFPLCHMGISGECPKKFDEEKCGNCDLKDVCRR